MFSIILDIPETQKFRQRRSIDILAPNVRQNQMTGEFFISPNRDTQIFISNSSVHVLDLQTN